MPLHLWTEHESAAVARGERITLDFLVTTGDGRAAAGEPIAVAVDAPELIRPLGENWVSDDQGRVSVTFCAGGQMGTSPFQVAAGDAVRRGTLFVTEVHVELPKGNAKLQNFSAAEESLLQMLYWDKDRVSVLRQFGGGLSGSRVVQVQSVDGHGANVTQVVKLGARDSMLGERDRYGLFKGRLARATPIVADAVHGNKAAIVYGDATASKGLAPCAP